MMNIKYHNRIVQSCQGYWDILYDFAYQTDPSKDSFPLTDYKLVFMVIVVFSRLIWRKVRDQIYGWPLLSALAWLSRVAVVMNW